MIRTQISFLPGDVDVHAEFFRWITQYCDGNSEVLDVGAGKGRTGHAALIQTRVRRLVGVDPDAEIEQNPYLHECHQASIEEFAQSYDARFNCLYARMVLEHVAYPLDFLSACKSLLKPGGMLFGLTPNLWHYFGITTKISATLGIENWLLGCLIGPQARDSYHFPTTYRLNSIRCLRRTLEQVGFQAVEFICVDPPRGFEYCFPRRLRWFPSLYSRFVYSVKQPRIMGLIMFRAFT
jgi:SAM-dependent methyltransferase